MHVRIQLPAICFVRDVAADAGVSVECRKDWRVWLACSVRASVVDIEEKTGRASGIASDRRGKCGLRGISSVAGTG